MGAASLDEVQRLRSRLEEVEGRRMDAPVLPVHPALAALLPGGGLRAGAAYSVAPSGALLLALLARPSREGAWCAVVGMPEWGAEAADQAGILLERLVLVPEPGPRWFAVTAALVDVLPLVVVRPPRAPAPPRRRAWRPGSASGGRRCSSRSLAGSGGIPRGERARVGGGGPGARAPHLACAYGHGPLAAGARAAASAAPAPRRRGSAGGHSRAAVGSGADGAAGGGVMSRVLVLWVPDWAVVAFRRDTGGDADAPTAVVARNTIVACDAAARAEGVRAGQRRRDAQARCPQLVLTPADPLRDQRAFAPLVSRIEQAAPGCRSCDPDCAPSVLGSGPLLRGRARCRSGASGCTPGARSRGRAGRRRRRPLHRRARCPRDRRRTPAACRSARPVRGLPGRAARRGPRRRLHLV